MNLNLINWTICIQEKFKNVKEKNVQSQWRVVLLCHHIFSRAELRPERATYKTLHNLYILLNGLSRFAQNFTVGFLKLLSTHLHVCICTCTLVG